MLPVIVGGWGPLDFATRAATSHKRGVISVDTFWDIGMGDQTAIWFHQHDGLRHRLIDYHSNSGESLPHYDQETLRRCMATATRHTMGRTISRCRIGVQKRQSGVCRDRRGPRDRIRRMKVAAVSLTLSSVMPNAPFCYRPSRFV
jgi:hypothetical protein